MKISAVVRGTGVAVGSGVKVGSGVGVGAGVSVGTGVKVGSGVGVGAGVSVGSGVPVEVASGAAAGDARVGDGGDSPSVQATAIKPNRTTRQAIRVAFKAAPVLCGGWVPI